MKCFSAMGVLLMAAFGATPMTPINDTGPPTHPMMVTANYDDPIQVTTENGETPYTTPANTASQVQAELLTTINGNSPPVVLTNKASPTQVELFMVIGGSDPPRSIATNTLRYAFMSDDAWATSALVHQQIDVMLDMSANPGAHSNVRSTVLSSLEIAAPPNIYIT